MRVASAAEARVAREGGADRIALTDAQGPISPQTVQAIAAAARPLAVSGLLGALSDQRNLVDAAGLFASCGLDAIELQAGREAADFIALAGAARSLRAVAVFPVENEATLSEMGALADSGFRGALLSPRRRPAPRLIDVPGIEALAQFVERAQRRGLEAWFEGALEPPDIPRLLALRPNGLVFRASVCAGGDRTAALDPQRLAIVRDMIPRGPLEEGEPGVAGEDLPLRAPDKVFVRDFVVEAGIGAYRYEHRAPQRMRFNVEADLAPIPADVADMRDVFSYDVIVDAIRLATRRHALLVERVAQDVASATLRDSRVRRVRVRLEKLDILDGSVGVEIERDRG